ncbi:MAG: hypothetical protein ACQESG_06965 [Nanobdellota archaeon]
MIAAISSQADIAVYVTTDEVGRLSSERLEGVLIRRSDPKDQGVITLELSDARPNGFGIGVDSSLYGARPFQIGLYMATGYYEHLVEQGRLGMRHKMRDGSQVDIYDRSQLDTSERMNVEMLDFYQEYKDQICGL